MSRTIATNTRTDHEGLLDFVRPRHRFVLITQRADGTSQASPVTGGVDDAGRLVVSTYPERAKDAQRAPQPPRQHPGAVRRLERPVGPGQRQRGGARRPGSPGRSGRVLPEHLGEHPDWDEYRQAMLDQGKSLIRVTPTDWGPIATGGFPARLA